MILNKPSKQISSLYDRRRNLRPKDSDASMAKINNQFNKIDQEYKYDQQSDQSFLHIKDKIVKVNNLLLSSSPTNRKSQGAIGTKTMKATGGILQSARPLADPQRLRPRTGVYSSIPKMQDA